MCTENLEVLNSEDLLRLLKNQCFRSTRVGYVETIVPSLEDASEEAEKVVSEVLTTAQVRLP